MTAGPAVAQAAPGTSVRPSLLRGRRDDAAVPPGAAPAAPSSQRPSVLAAQTRKAPSEPWNQRAVVRLLEIGAACLIGLGVAWFGAAGTTDLAHQLLWITLGIAAVAVGGVGQAMFVLEALRVLRARRLAVMDDVSALAARREARMGVLAGSARSAGSAATAATVVLPLVEDDEWVRVAAPTMHHYHRPGCQLAAGKPTFLRGRPEDHAAAGRTACGVCAA